MDVDELRSRVAEVRERIERARERAGRTDQVTLVAVTKTHPPELLRTAIAAGLTDLGENRVQELDAKVAELGREAATWHLIGHLQRNKAARAVALCDLLHSVDSRRLAEAVSAAAEKAGSVARVLVQVNASGEETKGGFTAAEAAEAVARVAELPGLRVEGLMTMAPFTDDQRVIRATFAATRRALEDAARQVPALAGRQLSMGMSNDYELAVEEGATLVRVGSVLFGERE
jgi:pyridoxal phosphate enzyme (YggS family)